MNAGETDEKSPSRKLIVDTRTESVSSAADSQALSTMAWNHCPRSLEYAATRQLLDAAHSRTMA
jgi:hypothetical protein